MTTNSSTHDLRQDTNRAIQTASIALLMLFCGVSFLLGHSEAWAEEDKRCESTEVRLLSRTLDGQIGIAPAVAFQDVEDNKRLHLLVRFNQPLTLGQHKALDEHGIELLEYIENCAYIASMSKATWVGLIGIEGEIGKLLGRLKPEDKISADLWEKNFQEWAKNDFQSRLRVLIGFHRDVTDKQAEQALKAKEIAPGVFQGSKIAPKKRGPYTWEAIVDIGSKEVDWINEIAEIESVRWIEQGPGPYHRSNNAALGLVKTDVLHTSEDYRLFGKNIRIGIFDEGVDENHPSLRGLTSSLGVGALREFVDWTEETSDDTHGTFVASIAVGNGINSENYEWRGQAPLADFGDMPKGADEEVFKWVIVDYGATVTNHSYDQSSEGKYELEAVGTDLIISGGAEFNGESIPARPQVWSAGNHGVAPGYDPEGYYSIKVSAKNAIVVGSIDTNDGRLSSFSSLGPSWDGRIKPDLVAPGCVKSSTLESSVGFWAAKANTTEYVVAPCGTSFAAPIVTGIISLMTEQHWSRYRAFPRPRHLRPATYKAILVNTAADQGKKGQYASRDYENPDTEAYVLFGIGPDFATGFGLVDARRAVELIENEDRWIESALGFSGDSDVWCISVPPDDGRIKVTLAWDDEPGSLGSEMASKLVNDLDLLLVAPTGEKTRPWTLAAPAFGPGGKIDPSDIKPAERDVDRHNNVEMGSVNSPESGIWRVVVGGRDLTVGRSQHYSLAASHEFLQFCPVAPQDLCDRVPVLCPPLDVCAKYPGFCQTAVPMAIEVVDRVWTFDFGGPISVNTLRTFIPEWPDCDGKSWEPCPGWKIAFDGIPERVTTVLFDLDGQIIQEVTTSSEEIFDQRLEITMDRVFPGQDFFLGFLGKNGKPYPDVISTRIDFTPFNAIPGGAR